MTYRMGLQRQLPHRQDVLTAERLSSDRSNPYVRHNFSQIVETNAERAPAALASDVLMTRRLFS